MARTEFHRICRYDGKKLSYYPKGEGAFDTSVGLGFAV
jgi:hypothetical protein